MLVFHYAVLAFCTLESVTSSSRSSSPLARTVGHPASLVVSGNAGDSIAISRANRSLPPTH